MENGHVKSGLYVQVLTDLVDVEALVILFEQVATEQDWQPGGQIRANTERAVHFAASVGDDLAGGLQLVLPDTGGCLPYMAVWPEIALPSPSQVAEVTVLAVKQEYRGRYGLFWPLCVELWRYCISEAIGAVVLEATPQMLLRYRRIGWPLEVIGELRQHWGEACYLCCLDVRTVAGSLLALALRSSTYRALIGQAIRPLASVGCRQKCSLQ